MKFGGSSVKDAGRIRTVLEIVRQNPGSHIVCSAMKGVTDQLIGLARCAETGDERFARDLDDLRTRHFETYKELLGVQPGPNNAAPLFKMFDELKELLQGVLLIHECSPRSMDLVMSFGERMSNWIIAEFFKASGIPSVYIDARQAVRTDDSHGAAVLDEKATYPAIRDLFRREVVKKNVAVITGFIASTAEGITTTLGRNGSDYSASIFGAALGAEAIEIWTDVDGVLEADPRVVEGASVIPDLSIEEAMEMSYFGAEVLHPSSILPAIETKIPIWIKNTYNPQARGTRISTDVPKGSPKPAAGIASIADASMLNIVGGGMLGSKGLAGKIFSALGRAGINIIMISQASSEHSICLVIRSTEAEAAQKTLKSELATELAAKQVARIERTDRLEVISVIGGGMRGTPGVSGRLFSALGNAGVNVLAIAQGSSEMNISLVVDKKDSAQAIRAIHAGFFKERS